MTTPGPTLIKKCNHCEGLMKQRTIASGNTFGARFWTDGKVEARMMPRTPIAIRCPHCKSLLWIEELEEVNEILGPGGWGSEKPEYDRSLDALPFFEKLEAADYTTEFGKLTCDKDKESNLRTSYWHLMNDSRRRSNSEIAISSEEYSNLRRLLELLIDTTDGTRILRAEIHRELGEFKASQNELDHDFDDRYINAAQTIYLLQEEKNSTVSEIFEDEIFVDAWKYRRNPQAFQDEPVVEFDPSGPPLFEIKSREWWIKILGMLEHNWALVEQQDDSSVVVYFFHDCGVTKSSIPGYLYRQLKGRCAIIDSLTFKSVLDAEEGLTKNGFRLQKSGERLGARERPHGNFYDARAFESKIYSKQVL